MLLLIAGVGQLALKHQVYGIACVGLSPLIFWYFCLRKFRVSGGVISYSRPFFQTKRAPISSITRVLTVDEGDRSRQRRLFIMSRDEVIFKFNPKLFSLEDLSRILEEIHIQVPAASFDESSRAFCSKL